MRAAGLLVLRKIDLRSGCVPAEDGTTKDDDSWVELPVGGVVLGPGAATAISALLAAKLEVALPTRRRIIRLSRRRIGPGASSSSESLHPNPVVKPTPSRRSLPSRWRRLRTSLDGPAGPESAWLPFDVSDRTTVDVGDSIPSRMRICLRKRKGKLGHNTGMKGEKGDIR